MMKNFILAVFCLIISTMVFAQVPQKMSYQAVVRGSDNNLVINSEVSVRVSILQGSVDGETVYTETHSATTNANGLLTIEIGDGTSSDDFSIINWVNGPYFVKTETDVNGGDDYDIIGVSQMLSVPYAMYAQAAGNVPDVSGFLTEETDPTVPAWAKTENKPVYNYSEIEGTPDFPTVPTAVSAFENDANYITLAEVPAESQTLADAAALGNSVNAQLKNVTDPTDAQDAVTKSYVDNLIAQLQEAINNIDGGSSHVNTSIVVTGIASDITATSAIISAEITSGGDLSVTSRGFVYGTSESDLSQTVTVDGSLGLYMATLNDLIPNTTYYYKAYATNVLGTAYGDIMTFTTEMATTTGSLNGHDWVDLGLPSGTKWATCNVGASTPTAYGNYYAWGETTTKSSYTEDNYTYSSNPTTLPSNKDAATANWGGGWRMPTSTEMQELIDNCTVTWTTQSGVNGRLFTGSNGNSIFLPAAGYRLGSELSYAGSRGYYWSSSLYTDNEGSAWLLYFYSGNYRMNYNNRYCGLAVRPVCVSQN